MRIKVSHCILDFSLEHTTQRGERWTEVGQWLYHGNTGCAPNAGRETPMLCG